MGVSELLSEPPIKTEWSYIHGDYDLKVVDAMTVQAWYRDLNRSVLAKKGHDYLQDRSRMFHFGPNGIFGPGKLPADTWG